MMFTQLSAIFFFNFLLSLTSGNENPGRILGCYPEKLKYEEFKVEFLLSLNNYKINQVLRVEDLNPSNTDFDPRLRTAVVVHGHGGSGRSPFMQGLRSELLRWVRKLYSLRILHHINFLDIFFLPRGRVISFITKVDVV